MEADTFIQKCETVFRFECWKFHLESQPVAWTAMFLTEGAFHWLHKYNCQPLHPINQSWAAFSWYFLEIPSRRKKWKPLYRISSRQVQSLTIAHNSTSNEHTLTGTKEPLSFFSKEDSRRKLIWEPSDNIGEIPPWKYNRKPTLLTSKST